jgi:hypothetical protein
MDAGLKKGLKRKSKCSWMIQYLEDLNEVSQESRDQRLAGAASLHRQYATKSELRQQPLLFQKQAIRVLDFKLVCNRSISW